MDTTWVDWSSFGFGVFITTASLVGIALIVFLIWLIYSDTKSHLKEKRNKANFTKLFEFQPKAESQAEKVKQQFLINRRLRNLANIFKNVDLNEKKLIKELEEIQKSGQENKTDEIIAKLEDLDNKIKTAKKNVKDAKKDFWQTHELAKYFDYKVKKKYTDYLK